MSFSWSDYLKLAQKLVVIDDEAAQRSAISRAYYFVFHLAQERAINNGLVLQKMDGHKQTWNCFIFSPDSDCKKLGLAGQRLRDRRNKADYDEPYRGRITEEAGEAVTDAIEFSANLQSLPARHPTI